MPSTAPRSRAFFVASEVMLPKEPAISHRFRRDGTRVRASDQQRLWSHPTTRKMESFDALLDRLGDRIEHPLPGHEAHRTMAPRLSAREHALSIEERDCREAGVLALLVPGERDAAIVLTVRRTDLPDHGGQISFPGGQREHGERLRNTALRETEEEIGLPRQEVHIAGSLTPLYIPPSNFCVYPFLGGSAHPPPLTGTDEEVNCVLRVSVRKLLDPDTCVVEPWTLYGESVDIPHYCVGDHQIWGATAMMLAEVLALIDDVRETG